MAASPTDDATGPVGVVIKAYGSAIDETIQVLGVRTTHDLNRVPQAVVTLVDGSVATGEFPLIDGDDFKIGNEIEIGAFFGQGSEQTLF